VKRMKKRQLTIPANERIFHTPAMKKRFAEADHWVKENPRRLTSAEELDAILAAISPGNQFEEIDLGPPVGREVL